jgi:ABC-type lipoprotein export system ATPase subunit
MNKIDLPAFLNRIKNHLIKNHNMVPDLDVDFQVLLPQELQEKEEEDFNIAEYQQVATCFLVTCKLGCTRIM